MADLTWGSEVQSREEQRELKRMAILRTAAGMINEGGFRQMSLESLAQRLNISKPTLYYYIDNKDDILTGILDVAMQQLRGEIAAVSQTDRTGIQKLRSFLERYGSVMGDEFGACLITSRISAWNKPFQQQYQAASREILTAVRALIESGIADGSIAACNPKYVSSALLGTMNETVYWHLVAGKEAPTDAVKQFWHFFEKGLKPA